MQRLADGDGVAIVARSAQERTTLRHAAQRRFPCNVAAEENVLAVRRGVHTCSELTLEAPGADDGEPRARMRFADRAESVDLQRQVVLVLQLANRDEYGVVRFPKRTQRLGQRRRVVRAAGF